MTDYHAQFMSDAYDQLYVENKELKAQLAKDKQRMEQFKAQHIKDTTVINKQKNSISSLQMKVLNLRRSNR
jgi:hypothetical protein